MKRFVPRISITNIHAIRALVVAISLAAVTNSARGQLYGIEYDTGNLYQISTANAALSLVGNTGISNLGSLEYRPSNGLLYGIRSQSIDGFAVGSLYRINPANASTTLVGSIGPEHVFEGGLVIAPDGTAYATTMNGNPNPTLFKINLDTAATTTVGIISGGDHDINGLAWRSDNMLVGLDRVTNSLLAINPTTAASSVIAVVSSTVGAVGGMAAVGDSGYFSTSGPIGPGASNSLYSFNLNSGAHTLIGSFAPTVSGIGIGGLANVVPEPASVTLAALAIVPLFVRRRRRFSSEGPQMLHPSRFPRTTNIWDACKTHRVRPDRCVLRIAAIIFLGTAAIPASQAVAVPLTVQSFEILSDVSGGAFGRGINSRGDVAGVFNTAGGSNNDQAFAVINNHVIVLPQGNVAEAISNSGVVVGNTYGGAPFATNAGSFGLERGFLNDINDSDEYVGGFSEAGGFHAYRSSTGSIAQNFTIATSINTLGHITGRFDADDGGGDPHVFLDRNGAFEDLGLLGFPQGAFAQGINDFDQIVGTQNPAFRGFFWDQGVVTTLAPLAGSSFSTAEAINNAGIVVGTSVSQGTRPSATIWVNGSPIDLTALARPLISSGSLTDAMDISDNGWITGTYFIGNQARAYRLKLDLAEEVSWRASQHTGNFADHERWDVNHVPDQNDTAVFKNPGDDFVVLFTENANSDKLKIQDGIVDFHLNAKTYTLHGATDGKSLVIGDLSDVSVTSLILDGGAGSQLNALRDVSIGAGSELAGLVINDSAMLSVGGNLQLIGHNSLSAALLVNQGSVAVAGITQLAVEATTGSADNGVLNLENQSHLSTSRLEIGVLGSGAASILSGSSLTSDEVVLGVNSGSKGKLTISGTDSRLLALLGTGKVTVGDGGSAEMVLAAGGHAGVKDLDVGGSSNFSSTVSITGVGSSLNAEHVRLGAALTHSDGQLVVDGGGKLTSVSMFVGNGSNGRGLLKVSGSGSTVTVTQALEVSPVFDRGSVEVTDHAELIVGSAQIGTQFLSPVSEASVVVRDADWRINGDLTVAGGVGNLGQTSVTASGSSSVTVSGNMRVGSALPLGSGGGHVELTGSASLIVVGELTVRGSFAGTSINVSGGSIDCFHDVFLGGSDTFFGGVGDLSLAAGTRITTPTLHVGADGWLHGKGKVIGNLVREDGGKIDPGFSPGVLTIDGDYTEVGDGGMLVAEVGGTVLGDEYDQLNVTGNVTLAGTLVVRFIDGFAPRAGDEFAFLRVGGTQTGAYAHIEIENLEPGFRYDLAASEGGLSLHALNDGVFVSVPEPTTLVLLLVGMLTMFSRRRGRVS